ncbi:MAG: M56 family metallopeptidase [Bacteroidaceae bacterium]|nr:M56 family metallopeptidase [Bacteroidaceae bacterium]
MGTLTLYALKSGITLLLLYLPYTLILRKETFFRLNRAMLLTIIGLSLAVPGLDIHIWDNAFMTQFEPQSQAISAVMLPLLVTADSTGLPDALQTDHSAYIGLNILVALYIAGAVTVLLWKLIGLVRLIRFIPRGCLWTSETDGVTIYCHAGKVSPFSWMRSVVVGESDAQDGSAVLCHELAHIRMGHSWDTLFVSLAEVLQWFNPCIWMLDASLREVHEYEADDAVLRRGVSARDYQILLIEKAVNGSPYTLANAFNHSLLKNRITMMKRNSSPRWARMKALYALPLTLIAIGAFATPKVMNLHTPLPTAVTDVPQSTATDNAPICDKPEVQPEFKGGMEKLYEYLSHNIRYPEIAQKYGVQGRIHLQFVVEKDGSISDIKEIDIHNNKRAIVVTAYKAQNDSPEELRKEGENKGRKALQEEAIRVVRAMPNWTPARSKGQPVRTIFILPVMFRLK